ncbi:MAG: DUF1156 domain-containing protein [Desulfobacterales bacterium]|nr:DUF1156 domain-containing protein [Desulfobacterales bacterium]
MQLFIFSHRYAYEEQFPVSKVSKESYKERNANLGQTPVSLRLYVVPP